MAPKSKINAQMIADVSYEILKKEGEGALNARSIASGLECSTQPIYSYYKDMKDTDATEFFVEDNGDISFDGDPIDVNDTDAIDVDDDAEFEEDEAPVEEKPEEETKNTPKFQRDHSTWFTDVMDSIQAFFWDIGSKIHDFFKGIKNFFKPVDYYEVYGNINVA